MGRKRNNYLREFYIESDKECECKVCGHKISNYATNLKRHLLQNHGDITKDLAKKARNVEEVMMETKTKFTVEMSKAELMNACIDMIVKDMVPLTFFDSDSFKLLTKPLCTGLNVEPVNSSNIWDLVANKSEEVKSKMRAKLENEILNLKLDIITCNERVFLGLNVEIISRNKIMLFCLALLELEKMPTVECVQIKIENVLKDYKINKKQLYAITNECQYLNQALEGETAEQRILNENFFVKVINNMGLENLISLKCPAQILQLSVKDFLEQNVLKASEKFKKMDSSLAIKSHLDIVTPWTSTYNMLKRLLELKDFSLNHLSVSETEWLKIENIVAALEPIRELQQHLQKAPLLLGDFYKHWMELIFKLKNIASEESAKLLREIEKRQPVLLENDTMYAALYLDPRFRRTLTKAKKQMAIKHLKKIFLQMQSLEKENIDAFESATIKTEEYIIDDGGNTMQQSSCTFLIKTFESSSAEDAPIKTEATAGDDYTMQSPSSSLWRQNFDSSSHIPLTIKKEIDDYTMQSSSSAPLKLNVEPLHSPTIKTEFYDYTMQSSSSSLTEQNIKSLERLTRPAKEITTHDCTMQSCSYLLKQNIESMERPAKTSNDHHTKQDSSVSSSLLQKYLQEMENSNNSSDDASDTEGATMNVTTRQVFCEIENYKEKRLDIDQDLLEYWNNKKFMLPWLRKLAVIVHSVPVTQITNEKSVAALQILLADLRYNLAEKDLEAIMFLRLNEDF